MIDVQITETGVRRALSALRYARDDAGPLVGLRIVDERLRADGIVASVENARWALAALLDERVWAELSRLRGDARTVDRSELTPERELELLVADFQAGHAELEAWSTLYTRYLSTAGVQMSELPARVGLSRATLARRLNTAVSHLTDQLREAERRAQPTADRRPGAPASERIVVRADDGPWAAPTEQANEQVAPVATTPDGTSEPAPTAVPATPPDPSAALLAAVRDDALVVRLSPAQLAEISAQPARDWTAYRLGRIAEWSLPRYRLDERFIDLSVLVDRGDESDGDRWQLQEQRFAGLGEAFAAGSAPVMVLLGPPGSGKSTLLRHLELELAVAGLKGEGEQLTFFVPLGLYRPAAPGAPLPPPGDWLAEQWTRRQPGLPPLPELLTRGGLVLLLDALNEMPHLNQSEYRAQVLLWKRYLQEVVDLGRGNRVLLSCRSLEYSAPISTPELRVPQLRIEPLRDEQIERFLQLYSPARAADLWRRLRESDQLDLLRSPYLLRLLVDHVASGGDLPRGRAALFTGFVRQALRREVRRDNPLFLPPTLLAERDYNRVVRARRWKTPFELPSQGPLFPKLAELAFRLQRGEPLGEAAQVRADYDAALAMLGEADGDAVIRAGAALALLDEDTDRDQILFFHQLLQEYFAGRHLAEAPEPALVRSEWRAERSSPSVREALAALSPSEPLPPLPPTHWEETTQLAAEMAPDKAAFIEQLVEPNLALAGRCAAQPHVREALPAALVSRLRHALVARSRDPRADLRARIEAGLALGRLGDPRFEEHEGPEGAFLLPPMIHLPAGRYPIGTDEAYQAIGKTFDDNGPAHQVELAAFSLGAFPVSNAEYRCFIEAGGYEDDRWWDTAAARDWRRGVGTSRGERLMHHYWARVFATRPALLDELFEIGRMDEEAIARWQRWMAMLDAGQEAELTAELHEAFPDQRHSAPARFSDPSYGHPSRPVDALSWFEARAYCRWLSAQSGRRFRLPTEVEREAAGRGLAGRRYAWGDELDPLRANAMETHLQHPTPIGVFPEGDTPEGLTDICGNVMEWTHSRWGTDPERPAFGYPYVPDDGRESPEGEPDGRRVLRGGAFYHPGTDSACAMRARHHPTARDAGIGFRVAEG